MTRHKILQILFLFLPLPVFFCSLFVGAYDLEPLTVLRLFWAKLSLSADDISLWPDTYRAILFDIRLPRVVLAMLVGLALSVSGAALQAVFRNPLVDPYILGISSGAAFGCAVAIAFFPWLPVQLSAFLFGLLSVFMAYGIARTRGEIPTLSLVLSGIIVSALFTAMVSIVKFLVDPHKLSTIVYWLMGSLSLADWQAVGRVAWWILLGILPVFLMRWRLNALSMGDEEAKSLGINIGWERGLLIIATTMATAAVVSVSGIIGWVGLMIPHIVRMSLGPDHRKLIPASMTIGAVFVLLADDIARSASSFEIPVGIITTISGAPFFVYLLKKGGTGTWGR